MRRQIQLGASMGYAVELTLDEASASPIIALSNEIFRTCGGMDLTQAGGHPHISLAVFDSTRPIGIEPLLEMFALQTAPFPLQFSAVGTFPGPQGVVYLAPVVTSELLERHAHFHHILDSGNLASHGYYRPGNWVPHCTVGYRLPGDQISKAVALCREADLFDTVTLSTLRFIEFPPAKLLSTHPLHI